MNGRACKTKGKQYERHVANVINLYFNSSCRRTPCSGAIQDRFPGDIMDLPPELNHYTIECKKQQKCSIWEWLSQAEKEGLQAKKIPLLVFSRNNSKDYVCLEWTTFLDIVGELYKNVDKSFQLDNAGPIC